jgi:hypothetical protein
VLFELAAQLENFLAGAVARGIRHKFIRSRGNFEALDGNFDGKLT